MIIRLDVGGCGTLEELVDDREASENPPERVEPLETPLENSALAPPAAAFVLELFNSMNSIRLVLT